MSAKISWLPNVILLPVMVAFRYVILRRRGTGFHPVFVSHNAGFTFPNARLLKLVGVVSGNSVLNSICAILTLLISFPVNAQKLVEAAPETQGFSNMRLQRIKQVMNDYVVKGEVTGTAYIIVRNGKIVLHEAVGYDDPATRSVLKRDAIFRIASQTKAVTSVAAMILYEEGKLLLDDRVSRYIPSFKNPQLLDKFNEKDSSYSVVPAKREVTIQDLLTHTSGIGYAQIGSKEARAIYAKNFITAGIGSGRKSLAEDMQKLGALPLMHNPGEKFTYGLNSDVLGYVIEVISGMSLDEFFRKKIFEPLGMKDTYFNLPPGKYSRLVNIFTPDSTGKLQKAPSVYDVNGSMNLEYPKSPGTYFSGGAGLSSTVLDYAIFLQMLLNGGVYDGKRILSRHTVDMMIRNQIGDVSLGQDKFGLGFALVTEKTSGTPASVGTFSWGGAFSTDYWADPKEKIVALIYKQVWGDQAGETADKFKVLVYSALQD